MKRSEINKAIKEAEDFFRRCAFNLPEWAHWPPEQWHGRGHEIDEIRNCRLGWDITDFGSGDFRRCGLLLFTLRNGGPGRWKEKTYAEKIMLATDKQVTPTHFHWRKMEDIINRGGARLVMKLWKADADEKLSNADFSVQIDGVTNRLKAGDTISLSPGQSITLEPMLYHSFWAEGGMCLIGEVSKVNDDEKDNRFLEKIGRFPRIEEDEPALRPLCNEYPPVAEVKRKNK